MYCRYPATIKDSIFFVSNNSIWRQQDKHVEKWLSLQYGKITSLHALSTHLVFVLYDESNRSSDIYAAHLETRMVTQITFCGARTDLHSIYNDQIFFTSNYMSYANTNVYCVTIGENPVKLDEYSEKYITHIAIGSDKVALQYKGYGYSYWRNYKGGLIGSVSVIHKKDMQISHVIENTHNTLTPVWMGERLFVLSDQMGCGNIFEYDFALDKLIQCTFHTDYYVVDLHASTDKLYYSCGGEIYVYDTQQYMQATMCPMDIYQDDFREHLTNVSQYITSSTINNEGTKMACAIRGKVYELHLKHKDYACKQNDIRHTIVLYLSDNTLVTVKEYLGDIHFITTKRVYTIHNVGTILHYSISNTDSIVFVTNRNEIYLINLKHYKHTLIDSVKTKMLECDITSNGQWIVYGYHNSSTSSYLILYNVSKKQKTFLTNGQFLDFSPKFDTYGKYIYFLSFRDFNAKHVPLLHDYTLTDGVTLYALILNNDPNPFTPWLEEETQNKKENEIPKNISIALDKIMCVKSSIKTAEFVQIWVYKQKIILASVYDHDVTLYMYNFTSDKLEEIAKSVHRICFSQNKEWMSVVTAHEVRFGKFGEKFSSEHNHNYETDKIDFNNINILVEPRSEWQNIFDESWWLMKEYFWNRNSSLDWDMLYKKYTSLLPKATSRTDINFIIGQMYGEMQTSHAYVLNPGDLISYEEENGHGYLAAEFAYTDRGYIVKRIINSPYYIPAQSSPLQNPGYQIYVGDIITHINGYALTKEYSVEKALRYEQNKIVRLQVIQAHNKLKEITVYPLKYNKRIAYQDFVKTKLEYVQKQTDNKIGYVHIPNMQKNGFEMFLEQYLSQTHKAQGMIVDVRFNAGGNVSDLILDFLKRRHGFLFVTPYENNIQDPEHSILGPLIFLCNGYTASDGEFFLKKVQMEELGLIIGERTWGGVIGICPNHKLIDNGVTSQPQYSPIFQAEVENVGIIPNVTVHNSFTTDADLQLDEAIKIIMQKILTS